MTYSVVGCEIKIVRSVIYPGKLISRTKYLVQDQMIVKFYHYLVAITLDLAKVFKSAKELGHSWANLPKNRTQVKERMFQ